MNTGTAALAYDSAGVSVFSLATDRSPSIKMMASSSDLEPKKTT
jgi:hypothetical protein